MHDPKFEKEVQQKMEELSFSPPEAVWLNVEKAVRGEKKKRRILPFWLFFAPAVLLMGAGMTYFMTRSSPAKPATVSAKLPETAAGRELHGAGSGEGTGTPAGRQPDGVAQAPAIEGAKEVVQPESVLKKVPMTGVLEGAVKQQTIAKAPGNGSLGRVIRPENTLKTPRTEDLYGAEKQERVAKTSVTAGAASLKKPAHDKVEGGGKAIDGPAVQKEDQSGNSIKENNEIKSITGSNTAENLKYALINSARPVKTDRLPIGAKALPSLISKPAGVELSKPRHPWEAGFVGNLGVSSVNQGLLDKLSVTSMDYRNSYSPVQSNPKTYTSSVQPDLSLAVGVLMQKGISRDWAFSIGLNFHYYSSRIKTGGMVTAPYALASPSLNTTGSFVQAAAAVNYPYYAPGDRVSYTNRYYFMELPASAIWQVGHSRKLPVFLEGGVSFSYLVSSNSLYYEPKAGVFYKDGSMINKTQTSVFSGLMFGLPIKGLSIQAGPQLQYGLTNLINNSSSGNQHLMYGGIKVVFLPGRSKPRLK